MSEKRPKENKKCKWCDEPISAAAAVCKYCNRHQGSFWRRLIDWPAFASFVPILISVVMMVLTWASFRAARRERLDASTAVEEVKKVANTMVKMSYLVADGARGYGGLSEEHLRKIKEYEAELKGSLDPNLGEEIKKDIREVHEATKSAIDQIQ